MFLLFCIMRNLSKFYKKYIDHPLVTNPPHFESLLWSIKIMYKPLQKYKEQTNKIQWL